MKKALTIFLAFLMLASVLCACTNPGQSEDSTTTAAADATTVPEETEKPLPELELADFNGEEFLILWPEQHPDGHFMHNEISVEESSGDMIDDAVFTRNSIVEEKYHVKIVSKRVWCSTIPSDVKKDFSVGDTSYGAFCAPIGMVTSYAIEGVCADFNDMKYYSEDQPWWNHDLMQDYSLAGARFFGLGDIIISDNYYPYCIFANSEMYKNYQFSDDLFELVVQGKWTVDKLMELCKSVPASSDAVWDYTDTYGILVNPNTAKALYYAFDKTIVRPTADGDFEWLMTVDYAQNSIEKIVSFFHDDNIAYDTDDDIGHNIPGLSHAQTAIKMFTQGQSLFYAEELITAERLKAADSDVPFWLLPMPKYTEEQADYHCILNDATVVCVQANQDLDKCSLILSAMGRESIDTLTVTFFKVVLASRYMNDAGSVAMLDRILASAKAPDIVTLLNYGSFVSSLKKMAQNGSTDFASVYKSYIKGAEAQLNMLKKQIAAIKK